MESHLCLFSETNETINILGTIEKPEEKTISEEFGAIKIFAETSINKLVEKIQDYDDEYYTIPELQKENWEWLYWAVKPVNNNFHASRPIELHPLQVYHQAMVKLIPNHIYSTIRESQQPTEIYAYFIKSLGEKLNQTENNLISLLNDKTPQGQKEIVWTYQSPVFITKNQSEKCVALATLFFNNAINIQLCYGKITKIINTLHSKSLSTELFQELFNIIDMKPIVAPFQELNPININELTKNLLPKAKENAKEIISELQKSKAAINSLENVETEDLIRALEYRGYDVS